MNESPRPADEASISELSVELLEQAAALAGERISAPIRAAGAKAAKLVVLAGAAAGSFAVALVFLGVGIGLAIGRAPEPMRWWICLLVAVVFAGLGGALAATVAGRSKESRDEQDPSEGSGCSRPGR